MAINVLHCIVVFTKKTFRNFNDAFVETKHGHSGFLAKTYHRDNNHISFLPRENKHEHCGFHQRPTIETTITATKVTTSSKYLGKDLDQRREQTKHENF